MTSPTRRPTRPWKVGDRFWHETHGTGTVVKLRERPPPASPPPEALVAFTAPSPFRQWMILAHKTPFEPDEPDRPAPGLHEVVVGQTVWHTRWGHGTVRELRSDDQWEAASVEFAGTGTPESVACGRRTEWIALGGGHLLSEPPVLALEALMWADESQWVCLALKHGLGQVDIDFDGERSSFDDLLAWLEAVALGVHLCAVEFVSLTGYRALEARGFSEQPVKLRVSDSLEDVDTMPADILWEVQVPRREVVAVIYAALVEFASAQLRAAADADSNAADAAQVARDRFAAMRSERIERWLEARAAP